jgi:hypothetical protein
MSNPPAVERDFVTIVSGLPRSGTSMMLRMLTAGGLPILTDGVRGADEDNPHGYLEWEAVKSLKRDASWVAAARGKGVKVIYYFLRDLPADCHYRVIFMRRDIGEVLASQTAMLERRGIREKGPDDARMQRLFETELQEIDEWLAGQPVFSVLNVDYRAVLDEPVTQAERVNEFLGGGLDCQAMATMVDPALYRSRVD